MLQRVPVQRMFSFMDAGTPDWSRRVAALRWPCRYSAYEILGEHFYRSLTDLPSAYADAARGDDVFGSRADKAAAMWLALGLANATLAQGVRHVIEIAEGAARDDDWSGSIAELPLLAWLRSNSAVAPTFLDRRWQRTRATGTATHVRQAVKNAAFLLQLEMPWARQRPRQVTDAPLFDGNRDKMGLTSPSITVSYSFLGLDTFAPEQQMRPDVRDIAAQWSHEISRHFDGLGISVIRQLAFLADYVFSATVSTAWRDMHQVKRRMPRRRLGERLISGTPTHAGRTLGWWYRSHGLLVERCAHGGDRGTHIDYCWDLAELPFCSRYITHGVLEKNNLAARAASGIICRNFLEIPAFESYGSPKHKRLFENGRRVPRSAARGRRLLYLPGLYGTEIIPLSPIFKTPDHLYAEWQYSMIEILKGLNYDIEIKAHPDGIIGGRQVLSQTGCKIIEGIVNFETTDYDCFLFDFPGSAWFDCLASQQAMVLIDLGIRPLDPLSSHTICERCPIIKSFGNNYNLLRVDPTDLSDAITMAMGIGGCDERTAKVLFSDD
jgi:hypothetical protein